MAYWYFERDAGVSRRYVRKFTRSSDRHTLATSADFEY